MNLPELIQSLEPGVLLQMFELDMTAIGGTDHLYFHNGTDATSLPIVWKGVTYQPWAIDADGWEMTGKGTLPRPRLRVANIAGSISELVMEWDDLVGAKLIRRRTFARYLDGQPGADPTQGFDDDIYFIERKVDENPVLVEFELASALDLTGVRLPNRLILASSCGWEYRLVSECPYTGTDYFDTSDQIVTDPALDVCSKKVSGCKLRFGARGVLPFGGFPAARTYKV